MGDLLKGIFGLFFAYVIFGALGMGEFFLGVVFIAIVVGIYLVKKNNKNGNDLASQYKRNKIVTIDNDKYEDKKTIKSKKSIRIDMSDSGAALSSMMSKRGGVLDAMSAGIQYLEMKFRYVETQHSSALMIDIEYYGNNWLFLRDGDLVLRIDSDNRKFKPYHQRTNVQDGGKVKENESYLIGLNDLEVLSKASKIEGQITGQSVKVPFAFNQKQKNIISEFHAVVFTGDDPLFDPDKFGKTTDDSNNTEHSVETSDPPVEKNIETKIDLTTELEKLSNLQDKGLIDEEEYSLAKKKLLGT